MDEELLLIFVTLLSSLTNSSLETRFSMENTKYVKKGNEGMMYSLFSCIPELGLIIRFILTTLYTEYFRINHSQFKHLAEFNAVSALFMCIQVFYPLFM